MSKLDNLKFQAARSAAFRRHSMSRFKRVRAGVYVSTCSVCGMTVAVDTDPPPNGIDIGGEAVALDCKGSEL